jgi:uncharacterized membrane protein (DUF4010 family)
MSVPHGTVLGLAVALGCGLLIGIERERRKGRGPRRALAGVRTFTLAALLGAVAAALAEPVLVGAGAAFVLALAAIGYFQDRRQKTRDPGVTTELALLLTYLLGVTAMGQPSLAAGSAVVVAIILAARSELHRFSTVILTERELRDALLLGGAALVVLPAVPSTHVAWLGGVDPRRLWALVVLLIGLQAAGYVALRTLGARLGLALSGLASGFISSTATIAAMGVRARTEPKLLAACVSGALFSNVATVLQLVVVTLALYPPALRPLAPPLGAGVGAALIVALASLRRAHRAHKETAHRPAGRAFSVWAAGVFAGFLTAVTAAGSFATARYGRGAADVTAALAGFVDVHAAAASVLSLAAGGGIVPEDVLLPILLAFTTNTASKAVAAWSGGRAYGARVTAGLVVLTTAVWAAWLVFHVPR